MLCVFSEICHDSDFHWQTPHHCHCLQSHTQNHSHTGSDSKQSMFCAIVDGEIVADLISDVMDSLQQLCT